MSKSIFDLFPPPRFLQMAPVGLSISDSALRFVDLRGSNGKIHLKAFAEKVIPPGMISGGYVHNIEELTKIVRAFKVEHDLNFIRAALPEEKAYLFKTEIPDTAEDSMRDSVEFKIEENVPLSVSNAVFDYSVIQKHKNNEAANHTDVIVSVLPIKVVSTYIEVLESAGLTPVSFEVESQAVARSVIKQGDKNTYLVVNLGLEKTSLYVISSNVVHFASTFILSKETTMRGLELTASFADKTALEKGASCDALWMQEVANEIQKLFSYWHTHEDKQGELGKHISKIIMCGDHPELGLCIGPVSSSSKVPVTLANVWTNAFSFDEFIPDIPLINGNGNKDSSLKYAAAIGLALPE